MSNELGLKDLFDYGEGKAATLLDDFGWAEHGNGDEPERDGEQSPPPVEPSPVTDEPDPVVPVGATAEETPVATTEEEPATQAVTVTTVPNDWRAPPSMPGSELAAYAARLGVDPDCRDPGFEYLELCSRVQAEVRKAVESVDSSLGRMRTLLADGTSARERAAAGLESASAECASMLSSMRVATDALLDAGRLAAQEERDAAESAKRSIAESVKGLCEIYKTQLATKAAEPLKEALRSHERAFAEQCEEADKKTAAHFIAACRKVEGSMSAALDIELGKMERAVESGVAAGAARSAKQDPWRLRLLAAALVALVAAMGTAFVAGREAGLSAGKAEAASARHARPVVMQQQQQQQQTPSR